MENKKNKKTKISITINNDLNDKMNSESINKSKLIEKLLINYYENKKMY